MSSQPRPYWFAVLGNLLRVLFWPEQPWLKFWHLAILLGAALSTELRGLLERNWASIGWPALSDTHYYSVAALLAIGTLALEVAFKNTKRVVPSQLRFTSDEDNYYLKLRIRNVSAAHCMLWVQLRILHEGTAFSKGGRDSFVLLTEQRAAERRATATYDPSMRRRFNLGPYEEKDLELLTIGRDLAHAVCNEELGEVTVPVQDSQLEITANGGTRPWSGNISMRLDRSALIFAPIFKARGVESIEIQKSLPASPRQRPKRRTTKQR